MASETYGKKILQKYGYTSGPLGVRKTGITQPLFPIPGWFNGHKIVTYKAIFNERQSNRWILIRNLSKSLEQKKTEGKTSSLFFPSGLTLQKLHLSK